MSLTRPLHKILRHWALVVRGQMRQLPMDRHGSPYGAWSVPRGLVNDQSVCYLAGAGTDISFDLSLVAQTRCQVLIFDPTPKAREHYEQAVRDIRQGLPYKAQDRPFVLAPSVLDDINFVNEGLWDKSELLKFYAPADKAHVSHSALNLQRTDSFFEAQVRSVGEFMEGFGHEALDFLKLDIEGAEYAVLDDLLARKLDIKAIAVEFDELNQPLDKHYLKRVRQRIRALHQAGYHTVEVDANYNHTFVRADVFERLRQKNANPLGA